MLIALHKPYGVLSQFTPEPGSRWRTLADFALPVVSIRSAGSMPIPKACFCSPTNPA